MAQRKVCYYSLSLDGNANDMGINDFFIILLNYIGSLTNQERKQEMADERFCFLFSKNRNPLDGMIRLIFKSAKHSYRAPLIDKNTLSERNNPKTINEGELYKTHLVMKPMADEYVVVLESGSNLLTMKAIVDYLNLYIRNYDSSHPEDAMGLQFQYNIIPNDDFGTALENMDRVKVAIVTFHKQVLGSEALGFSGAMDDIQEEVEVTLKAKRNQSITGKITEALARLNGGNCPITKIRVKGVVGGVESVIDTSLIVKKDTVEVPKDEDTGQFVDSDMLETLVGLANNL